MPHTTPLPVVRVLRLLSVLAVLVVSAAGCGGASDDTGPKAKAGATGSSPSGPAAGEIKGNFQANGHDLHIECIGHGEPTMVLEVGEGRTRVDLARIQDVYASKLRVCSYDRANKGESGEAATPRGGKDLAADLHELLKAAKVPGPYLLVGHSAGGLLVLSYAATHPDEVAGVVALNPVAPWKPWMAAADKLMSADERESEVAFLTGTNGESLDYRDVSRQFDRAPAPTGIPLHLVASTVAQCPPGDSVCRRMAGTYQAIMKQVAEQWDGGRLTLVDASHDIAYDRIDVVKDAIDDVLARTQAS